ncbi:unnamed protein product [Bemisia tabaci]|uniref:Uncharacterized protein n=1 Tax=Bemisia tabaci TaxID=7038 RepID=A0A9P0A4L5_BEMTA|nr:unnamed protein product [Bemisia tabaci]
MFDGKVVNNLTETKSNATCNLCGITPNDMNAANVAERPVNEANFTCGLAPLHYYILYMECCSHISYRHSFEKWTIREADDKITSLEVSSLKMKKRFGLDLDKPKQGSGNSNYESFARTFFAKSDVTTEILDFDKELLYNFHDILRILNNNVNERINTSTFKELLQTTFDQYVKLYGWYKMPVTVHNVLVHGCDIIEDFDLPVMDSESDEEP